MHRRRYLCVGILFATAIFPWGIYLVGLCLIPEYPSADSQPISAQQHAWVWTQARADVKPQWVIFTPYSYVYEILRPERQRDPSLQIAWWAARDHLANHQHPDRLIFWHLRGAALTIWLTRNFSNEQVTALAYRALQRRHSQ